MAEIVLTQEAYNKKKEELDYLIKVKRPENLEKLKVAREQGDLSENADWDLAKDEQARIAAQIAELEETLKHAKIIDSETIDTTVVSMGCVVEIYDIECDSTDEYMIVGSAEANLSEGKISNESPLGSALIGHKEKDVVEVKAPAGVIKFKILSIHK